MPASAARAIPTASLVTRITQSTARRAFHQSSTHHSNHGTGGKPASDDTVTERDDLSVGPQAGFEPSGGRTRILATGPSRNRPVRKRAAHPLPPVTLPDTFLDENITLYSPLSQPRLPYALLEDTKHDKVSRLFRSRGTNAQHSYEALELYFETALEYLLQRESELVTDCLRPRAVDDSSPLMSTDLIERVARIRSMILDSAWHLVDTIYPARQAEYEYKLRPFWWWQIHKDFDHRSHCFRDHFHSVNTSLKTQLAYAEHLDNPLSHSIADLPIDTLAGIQKALSRDLLDPPPANFDSRTSKRQMTVLSMFGYGGSAITEAVAEHLAFLNQAHLVRLDAQELSLLVGGYLGQDWAYARGPLSMMGFRAAELNGKLSRDPELVGRSTDDEDADAESGSIGIRTASGSLEDELQKIRQGSCDCFSKWENLKIDKVLDHIIRSPTIKSKSTERRPVLIHVHDWVELSMTLEGSILIGRLRSLIDNVWQLGGKIALLGTSSCESPSEEYQSAIRDLAAGDLVVTRHIQPSRLDGHNTGAGAAWPPFNLQKTDYFAENIRNINRMIATMNSNSSLRSLEMSSDDVKAHLLSNSPRFAILHDSILPVPEVYHLACAFRDLEKQKQGHGAAALQERLTLGPLRQKPGQSFLDDSLADTKAEVGQETKSGEPKAEGRPNLKLNEYEKRIAAGQINSENIRTTFSDIHAPPDTISALKLLTSLALVRPDAFSYGVLAQDKIPGCLLYGPPGTGKTMLAKAVAKESGANMLEISGASINDKWVGESEKLIRAVFTLAKRLSPCVVFIDEADSLLANRSMLSNRASHREHINQFLKEWDGMEETSAFIMVATNRPFDLDDAVLRRLPRKILVDLPTKDDRAAILRLLLRDETLDSSVSLEEYAKRSSFYSGSDLKNVCVAAAMAAVEEENEAAAARQSGQEEPVAYPVRRTLRAHHFEKALKQIPASISEDMVSLKLIRKFDEEYGRRPRGAKKTLGFGVLDEKSYASEDNARIRQ